MSRIVFKRVEFVREYYEVSWTEEDYKSTVEWLSKKDDAHSIAVYGVLKDLSFNDIIDILEDRKDDVSFEVINNAGQDNEWKYNEYVGEFIRDTMREDCWNAGCYDTECDDSDEEIEIID